jgi:hypothetical protein
MPCDLIKIFLYLHLQIFFFGSSQGKCILNFYFDSGHCHKLLICCSMSAVPEPTSWKQLVVGCRVSGSFGELIPNPDPNKKQCVRKRLVGNVLHAVGHRKYMVAFDNGET